ncbi:TIGR03087 family PEP-CTERM/XrtA system glycosyltransferase [Rhodoferax sp. 4810]|uniref:TIGR03087 family PEP-CTERM/XrtA system glycosyltransferase n=1 Tax=Thiospirillum jenense TaxID=1653858 RepID=A0A839HEX1_9GAMM|nr:TIGR03087 family PEP-CTERM/XrtA system glycosyltransferase [Thiospirillum jenense]MBB1078077.1 TIGR03087 family PEP-CTERM/XrtA system glycosyltransferase [Rhodoferax jenense]MBB1127403.1 TIGR03087 family PEP-CTERM/XrtA system glycosyltransferase [Thiospirillum jenense]
MESLLFLTHRIPYPPNKGDKIRSFHLLEYLSQHYQIHLATFIDLADDWQYCDKVHHYCTTTWFGKLTPSLAKLQSLVGFINGQPLSLPYYYRPALARWIKQTCKTYTIQRVLVYSSVMAQYVMKHPHCVVDFVDVDSDKWRQYSATQSWPMRSIYHREAIRLAQFEQQVATQCAASIFVSEPEAALFRQQLNDSETAKRVYTLCNGVDTAFFAPDTKRMSPFIGQAARIVFTGAMDYWANIEGVTWFAHHIFPAVRETHPDAEFIIVGMNPTPEVYRLAEHSGIHVTGAVSDIRPYLQYAKLVVVPLRIARGIQNKVLEAMAMARPVVTTPQALEGIPAKVNREVYCAGDASTFIRAVRHLLTNENNNITVQARQFVEREFNWKHSLPTILSLLESN